jgi:hypothetical protein
MVYQMPQSEIKKLYAAYTAAVEGVDAESEMLVAAESLGYSVEDENDTPNRESTGGHVHNIHLVKRETAENGRVIIHEIWAHCNHPGASLCHHRGEWFCYFL